MGPSALSGSKDVITQGRVVLETTLGDLDVALYGRESPEACASVVAAAKSGVLVGLTWDRVVPGVLAQASGRPAGGKSSGRVRVQAHQRLRFTRRGLVALVNGTDVEHGLFVTLGPCEWLTGEHIIVGSVQGDSRYVLAELGALEREPGSERPVRIPLVTGARVLQESSERKGAPQVSHIPTDTFAPPPVHGTEGRRIKQKRSRRAAAEGPFSFGDDESSAELASAADMGVLVPLVHDGKRCSPHSEPWEANIAAPSRVERGVEGGICRAGEVRAVQGDAEKAGREVVQGEVRKASSADGRGVGSWGDEALMLESGNAILDDFLGSWEDELSRFRAKSASLRQKDREEATLTRLSAFKKMLGAGGSRWGAAQR